MQSSGACFVGTSEEKRLEVLPEYTYFPTPASHLNAAPSTGQSSLQIYSNYVLTFCSNWGLLYLAP